MSNHNDTLRPGEKKPVPSITGRATDKMVKGQNVWVQRTAYGILVHADYQIAAGARNIPVEQAVALEDADKGAWLKVITRAEMEANE